MRVTLTALVLVGAMAMADGAVAASLDAGADVQTSSGPRPAVSLGAYAVRGTVRAVDAASLVIVRSARRSSEMAFVLRPSTQREGTIAVGATVSVRYVRVGDTLIATAVFAHPDHQHTAARR